MKCPFCNKRLKHHLGSDRYYCPECKLHFFLTEDGIYYGGSPRIKDAKLLYNDLPQGKP